MSVIEIAKETRSAIKQLSQEKYVISRVSKTLRILATIVLVSILLNERLNLGIPLSRMTLNLWDETLRTALKSNIYKVCTFWLVYELLIKSLLIRLFIYVDKSEEVKSLPMVFTANDLVNLTCSIYFGVYTMNQLIEYSNIGIHSDSLIDIIAVVYLFIEFINWLYIKNSDKWYCIHRNYTYYFDVNNKRIPQKGVVIYRGKLFKVYWSGDVLESNKSTQRKEWRLSACEDKEDVSLEEAVKDREGNITVTTWKEIYTSNE